MYPKRDLSRNTQLDPFNWTSEQVRAPHGYAVRWVMRRARVTAPHASVLVEAIGIGEERQ
jgi:uncharacterized Fe-S cluster-containing MiaB family protein